METELKNLIVERLFLDIEPASIDSDKDLIEYGIDSFMLMEMIVAIEETLDIRFEPTDIQTDSLKSIASLKSLVESKCG
ncbi:MAG: acyl carrier protein [Lentisphaeria bacterium]|nr:acyl carrier protein [Lentisphaeria bacterium]